MNVLQFIVFPFVYAAAAAWVLGEGIRLFAIRFRILRAPGGRHMHKEPTPLLGGVVLFAVFAASAAFYPNLVITREIAGVIGAAALLTVVGILDDMRQLSWKIQLIAQLSAAMLVLGAGVSVWYVNNPFGGTIRLDTWLISFHDTWSMPVAGALFAIFWLILFANAFNWLDGINGAASGVGGIAAVALGLLSLRPEVLQPPLAILASLVGGAALALFLRALSRRSLFLGGSSAAVGFLIGALAIVAGAKVATAVLVFTIPFVDALWVITGRFLRGHSVFEADATHLHHRLMRRGWSHTRILYFLLGITLAAGVLGVALSGVMKLAALLAFFMIVVALFVFWRSPRNVI